MNTPFSTAYRPPAPVLEIEVAIPGSTLTVGPYTALIDTGADATLLPQAILISLGAASLYETRMRSAWGEPRDVVIYLVDIVVGTDRFPGIEVAADENVTEFILGRSFLNRLPLLLDGPQQLTRHLTDPTLQRLRAMSASD